jgi:hypothetical protein
MTSTELLPVAVLNRKAFARSHPRAAFLIQRRQKPAVYCRGGSFSFYLAQSEGAGLNYDRTQLGETAAGAIVEVYKPKRATGHCLSKKIHSRVARDLVLATKVVEGVD